MIQLSEYERIVYDAVKEIQEIKTESRQEPNMALLFEVYNFVRPELNEGCEKDVLTTLRVLYRKGLIIFRKNLNGIPMFAINDNKNTDDNQQI